MDEDKVSTSLSEQLSKTLTATTNLIHELHSEIHDSNVSVNVLKSDVYSINQKLESLTKSIDSLTKIVKDGNGTQPLTTRVLLLETNVQNISTWISKVEKTREESEKQIVQNNRTFKIALFSAGIGILGTLGFWKELAKLIAKLVGASP